jgi:hypothetical protein
VADGVVAAAQWTRTVHPSGVDRLVANLARVGISADRELVIQLLRDRAGAGAGLCLDGLIAKDGRVDPDDHFVVAGIVSVVPSSSPTPEATGALFTAEPRNSRLNYRSSARHRVVLGVNRPAVSDELDSPRDRRLLLDRWSNST